jgi:hypothetical protein
MRIPALEQLQARYHLSPEVIFFAGLALLLLTLAVLIVCFIFLSRVIKSHHLQHAVPLKLRYQKILNAVVIHETFSTANQPVSAFEYRMGELRALMDASTLNRQLLIDQILDIKKSLSGNSAKVLMATYNSLELYKSSIKKLKLYSWQKRALGIRELAEMNHQAALPQILKFLDARNATLREESFMAVVRLRPDNPLFFLDNYHHALTPWMRINIHHYLVRLDSRKLPAFSHWFNHHNTDVVLFSISMARQFRQAEAIPALLGLLNSGNEKILGLALETLNTLEAYEHADRIAALTPQLWLNDKLAHRLLNCLGKIGDPARHTAAIGAFLEHPTYSVRFQAALALKQLGDEGDRWLRQENARQEQALEKIIRHIEEPLLR